MEDERRVCINDALTDHELYLILHQLRLAKEKHTFGLVCRRWLRLQSSEPRFLWAKAGPTMLRRVADRFVAICNLDFSRFALGSSQPGVSDSDLSAIAEGFRNLRVLRLPNCKGVTDAGMISLGRGLPFLQTLDVSCCRKITDKGLEAIALGCPNLKRLNLTECISITDHLLVAVCKTCSHLEVMALSGCTNITDSGLSVLVDGCRHIKYLDLSKCKKIGDAGVSRVAEVCASSLRTLKLLDCSNIGDRSIMSLASSCKKLETLVIGGCREVSDESIKALAVACGQTLTDLWMEGCINITNISLSCVFANCKFLKALDVGRCKITDSAFYRLGEGGLKSYMKFLKANNCPGITVSGIGRVLQHCRSMGYLDLRSCPHVDELACRQAGLQFPTGCVTIFSNLCACADPFVEQFH